MECISCNAHNPDGTMYCIVCGADLPKSNPSLGMAKPKLAVFHVEETVLDNSAGERIAKRKGLSGKRFAREVAANLEKAVSRIGVKDYINRLARDNYTIAFISSLDSSYQYRLQDRLRHLGFPIMTDTTGPLVLMGSSQDNIRSLARRYDITFAFGTSPAGTAKQMNVPGVYATVEDYIGDSKNPYIAPTETPAPYTLSGLRPEPTPAPYTLANPLSNAPFDIKDAANMTEAERQAALRRFQAEQVSQREAEQARIDAAEAEEAARKARLAANIPALKSTVKGWAEKYLDPEMPQIIAKMREPPFFTAYAPISAGANEGFRGAALAILKDIHRNSRDAGYDMYAYLSDLYGVNVSLLYSNKYGMDQWKIKFDDNPANFDSWQFFPGRDAFGPPPDMTNPPPKPRRQKSKKTGKSRRESAKKYFERLMGNKKMNKEFPDNSQRSAVALSYVEKEYGKRGVNSVTKSWGAMANPDHIIAPRVSSVNLRHVFIPAKLKRLRTDRPWIYPGQTLSGAYFSNFQKAEGAPKGYKFEDLYFDFGNQPMETDVYVKDGSKYKKIGAVKTTVLGKGLSGKREHKGLSGKRPPMTNPDHFQPRPTSDSTPRTSWGTPTSKPSRQPSALRQIRTDPTRKYRFEPAKAKFRRQEAPYGYPRMGTHEQSKAHSSYAVAFNEARDRPPLLSADRLWFEDNLSGRNRMGFGSVDVYERVLHSAGQGRKIAPFETLTKEEGFFRLIGKLVPVISFKDTPMANPASPKKLKKAKDAYKKFHGGKKPDEVKTEKIDVGDVWYSLGECWTIGYMSPKENGNEFQKFIHEMNEESKDGNYPTLYATMPESGEPMLIIKGGSMKIGMRDGKAWLID